MSRLSWQLFINIPIVFCNCAAIIMGTKGTHSFQLKLRWRHNGRNSVSNHQPHDRLPNLYWDADQRKHQSSAPLAFVRGIHRRPINSPHKWPVTRKIFLFDDVTMNLSLFPHVFCKIQKQRLHHYVVKKHACLAYIIWELVCVYIGY